MLIGGAVATPKDDDRSPTGSFVSFSDDAKIWTEPQIVTEPGRWLWRVTWQDGKAYGVLYEAGNGDLASSLLVSEDGIDYKRHVTEVARCDGWPTEATIRFDDDGTMYCLQRRDGTAPANTAMFGISKPPYTEWEWHDLGHFFGGPNFIQLPSGDWIAAGRLVTDGKPKTVLARLDMEKKSLEPILELPQRRRHQLPRPRLARRRLWTSATTRATKTRQASTLPRLSSVMARSALKQTELRSRSSLAKPLYKFTEPKSIPTCNSCKPPSPTLRKRIVHLARKNIGQPYELYLLGEMPFESYDPQPHLLPGQERLPGVHRAHVRDGPVAQLAELHENAAAHPLPRRPARRRHAQPLHRSRLEHLESLARRRHHRKNSPATKPSRSSKRSTARSSSRTATSWMSMSRSNSTKTSFIPFEAIDRAKSELQDGDFVNIVRGTVSKDAPPSELSNTFGGNAWVGHVGLIVHGDDGEVHLIHSTQPKVREEPIDEYIARSTKNHGEDDAKGKARLLGFKFLRLRDEPLKNLREIDGEDGPKVTLPDGGEATFE